jgi:hypothetical protein
MKTLAEYLSIPGTICIILEFAAQITRNRYLALWGDVMVAFTFCLIAVLLLYFKSYWMGGAFAFTAIRQTYFLLAPLFDRK